MKINPINKNNYSVINKKSKNAFSKSNSQAPVLKNQNQISFSGFMDVIADINLKMEIKKQSNNIKKDANETQQRADELLDVAHEYIDESNDILYDAYDILRKADKVFSSAMNQLLEAKENKLVADIDGNKTTTFSINQDKTEYLKETRNGKTTKEVIVGGDRVQIVLYGANNVASHYVFDKFTQRLIEYSSNVRYSAVGYKAQERFLFNQDNLCSYEVGYSTKYSKSEQASKRYVFENTELKQYASNYLNDFDNLIRYDEFFSFYDSQLVLYAKEGRTLNNICESIQESFLFYDEMLYLYKEMQNIAFQGKDTIKKQYKFGRNGLEKATFNETIDMNGKITASDVYSYLNDKLESYISKYSKNDGKKETYARKINFN